MKKNQKSLAWVSSFPYFQNVNLKGIRTNPCNRRQCSTDVIENYNLLFKTGLHQTAKTSIHVLQKLRKYRKIKIKLSCLKFTSPRGKKGNKITDSQTGWFRCLNQGPLGASCHSKPRSTWRNSRSSAARVQKVPCRSPRK